MTNNCIAFLAAFAFAASGCAGATPPPIVIGAQLAEMKGKPVKALVAKIGEPDLQNFSRDGRVYVWDGSSKTQHGFWTNFSSCTLRIDVDKANIVTGFFYSGTERACAEYTNKLGPPPFGAK